ncbi:MAG: hypothetical protein KF752_17925 [Pirellulaceae bacterium]|nr:hypothetical protein [Pirellulaceae bacterium]
MYWRCAIIGGLIGISQLGLLKADQQLETLGAAIGDVQQTSAVWHTLSQRRDLELTAVLLAMRTQGDVAKNWYLALAQTIADRNSQSAVQECQQFLQRPSQDSTARYWAFSYICQQHPERREQLLETMTADSSLDLRYEAIQLQLDRLIKNPPPAIDAKQSAFKQLLVAARLPSQVQDIAKQLKESGAPVNLLEHFGFISAWHTVGPFDNSNQSGFNVVYPPEQDYLAGRLRLDDQTLNNRSYPAKDPAAQATWKEVSTEDQEGKVDLAAAYDKAKGALVYGLAEFHSPSDMDVEVRAGSMNAIKVWVNGQLAISREVYHAGAQVDQYTAPVKLQPGANSLLVKVCQNEQTESWAQDWYFQLRFSDSTGWAVRPTDRK